MNKVYSLDFYDFYFNGKKLSDFGWMVGGSNSGLKAYSVLPARTYVTDRPLNSDITLVFDSYLEPRVFEVPIFKEQINDGDLRKLSAWLNSPEADKFYYIGDDVYINACLDVDAYTAESISGIDGQLNLKFICYDPFYYSLDDSVVEVTSLTSGKKYEFENNSTAEIFPYITIGCSGDITVKVYDSKNDLLSTSNITGITAGIKIDCESVDCTLLSGSNFFDGIDNFPKFPQKGGNFSIVVTGSSLSNMSIEYVKKYI